MNDLMRPNRRQLLNLSAAAGAALIAPAGLVTGARAAPKPLGPVKEEDALIAFGHTGPVTDEGWTWTHDQGMKAVQAAYPKLKTVFVESIPYSADASRTFKQFVAQGANMVFATSNYGDFLYDVAKAAPEVAFFECDGRNPMDNLGTYYVAHWYPSYVAGVAAGLMSKTGKLGYVASFPVPSVFSGTNAFLMGARSINPKATMQVAKKWIPRGIRFQPKSMIPRNPASRKKPVIPSNARRGEKMLATASENLEKLVPNSNSRTMPDTTPTPKLIAKIFTQKRYIR